MPKGHYERRPTVDPTQPEPIIGEALTASSVEMMAATLLASVLPGDGTEAGEARLVAQSVRLARMIEAEARKIES